MLLPKEVEIHDDWFNESFRTKLIEAINWLPMYFLNRSERYESHPLDIHWYYPVAITEESLDGRVEDQLTQLEQPLHLINEAWQIIAEKIGIPCGLYECGVSANAYGTEGTPHFDFRNRKLADAHLSVLVYCNPTWEQNWAGETLFFDGQGEINGGVLPKPGRIVIIREDPLHVGRSVSRICPMDRRVLVFKFWNEVLLKKLLSNT